MADIVPRWKTHCSCGKELKGFAVDIGCVYEAEFPDQMSLMAANEEDAFKFCDGYSPVHDVIAWPTLFSFGKDILPLTHAGLHEKVPAVETSNHPRHPFFFRENE